MLQAKTCTRCLVNKPVNHFNRHPATRDKLQAYCKECARDYARSRRGVKPEDYRAPQSTESMSLDDSIRAEVARAIDHATADLVTRIELLESELRELRPLFDMMGRSMDGLLMDKANRGLAVPRPLASLTPGLAEHVPLATPPLPVPTAPSYHEQVSPSARRAHHVTAPVKTGWKGLEVVSGDEAPIPATWDARPPI